MSGIWVIPHTHWDREWYEPHDVFRARLVRMIDGLLDLLEAEPDYRFTLDGQSAAFEDYLEIRPEERERVRSAVERGQLALGPFQILLDEFACDGETIIRNLELGIRAARTMGREMRIGYLPDMFGHAAQMPQLLRGFGIADAALWRGVPGAVDRHAFVWEALNGDAVRVEYLWDGYGSALKLFEPTEKLAHLVAGYAAENAEWFMGEDIAGMYGTDHMSPRSDLAEIVRAYNGQGHDIAMRIATLEDVVESRDHSPGALARLPRVVGEMRSHARGNLLPGVFSIRTNLKAAMAHAERELTTAERFDALIGGSPRTAFFDRGWGLVVESTAHDSVTGCGVDATAEEVETRLHVASHTARGAIDIGLAELARLAPTGAVAVFNQLGCRRRVQAELIVEGTEVPTGAQQLESLPRVIGDERLTTDHLPRILRRIHGQELFGKLIRSWSWEDDELTFEVAEQAAGDFDLSVFTAAIKQRVEASSPTKIWRVRTTVPPSQRVLVAGEAEGLSAAVLSPQTSAPAGEPVWFRDGVLGNGLIEARVRGDGLVDVSDLSTGAKIAGALGVADEGDCGDSYNYGPVDEAAVTDPVDVRVEVLERGPLRGRVRIRRTFRVPGGLDASDRHRRSTELVEMTIDTVVELREGEPFLRVRVVTVNPARDHRVRVLVPTLDHGVTESASAGQYGVTERGRTAEGGWGEYPLPTFPGTRFVHAGRVGLLLDKLVEYEVIDGGPTDQVALTLLRGVGLMSVNLHPLRDEPAGSQLPTPGAQYPGTEVELNFGIDLRSPDWSESELMRHSELFRFDPVCAVGTGTEAATAGIGFATHGQVVLESLRRIGEVTEARLVNYSRAARPLRVRAEGVWDRCDLTGEVLEPDVNLWDLSVPGGTIVTLRRAPWTPSPALS